MDPKLFADKVKKGNRNKSHLILKKFSMLHLLKLGM